MSKILKRPMFRIGGSANDGVMSIAAPRKNYSFGSEYRQKYEQTLPMLMEAMGPRRDDRLARLLIGGGMNLVAGTGAGGGILPAIAKSFKQPTEEFFKAQDVEDALQRQLKLSAATQAMTSVDAERLAKIKMQAEQTAMNQKLEQAEKEMFVKYSGLGSKGLGVFETFKQLRGQGERILSEPITIKNEKPDIKEVFKIPKGTVFVDANARIYRKTDDSVGYEPIQTTGGIPVKPVVETEQGFFDKYGRKGLIKKKQELMEQLDKLRLQKTARGE
jgi:hypothetical protein